MSRRHKYSTPTSHDARIISNAPASAWIILFALTISVIFFIIGLCLVILFTFLVSSQFESSLDFTVIFFLFTIPVLIILSLVLFAGISIYLISNHKKEIEKKYRGLKIANIDSMSGVEFEQYLKRVLTNQGYSVTTTRVSGDLGVDLVASVKNDKIAIQAKRYNNKVSRRAISDAVAGMYHYGCNKAMVITNSYFSPGAIELAHSTGCILINRDTLAQWINEFQNTGIEIT